MSQPHQTTPMVHYLPGWEEDIAGCRRWEDLPETAQAALDFISDFVGLPIAVLSVGPDRDQTLWSETGRDSLLAASELSR